MFEKQVQLETSSKDNNIDEIYYYYGTVMDIKDPFDSKRIRVRIKGVDDKIADDKLPWCTSFLPLNIVTNPKIGEMVKVFFPSKKNLMSKREWCGPTFTSFKNLGYENARTALSNQDISNIAPTKSLNKIPTAKGAYVNDEDVAFQGRDNTDIIFKNSEVLIRAGKFVFNDRTKLNTKNPAYFQVKLKSDGSVSTASSVADKILLMTHSGYKKFDPILTDELITEIIKEALSAAYAEPIIEFLKLIKDFVVNHIHPQNLPANISYGKIREIVNFDLDKIKANNIKIN